MPFGRAGAPIANLPAKASLPNLDPNTFYGHFLRGTGRDVGLTTQQLGQVTSMGKMFGPITQSGDLFAQTKSFYGTALQDTFGTGTMIMDQSRNVIGFSRYLRL